LRRLVLYSNQIEGISDDVDRHLLSLMGGSRHRIGYVPSAADPSREWFSQRRAYYQRLGATVEPYFELDLDYRPELLSCLLSADAIHLSGGDTFHFLHWLRRRGLLTALSDYVDRGGVLIGVSAGSILMTPDIRSSMLCGDKAPYEPFDLAALTLVDFAYVPHWRLDWDPTPLLDLSSTSNMTVYAGPDDSGIVVLDDCVHVVGELMVVQDGMARRQRGTETTTNSI
jgi:dipeptidase E